MNAGESLDTPTMSLTSALCLRACANVSEHRPKEQIQHIPQMWSRGCGRGYRVTRRPKSNCDQMWTSS